jgi:hypothetical protein
VSLILWGGRLLNGAKEVRIYGEMHVVTAEVGIMRTMSAHGDYDDFKPVFVLPKCQFS